MKALFYVGGVLAILLSLLLFVASRSTIESITTAIVALTGVVSIGIGAILARMDAHMEAVKKADIHAWNIGLAQWEELKQPGGSNPFPDSDFAAYREYRPEATNSTDLKA